MSNSFPLINSNSALNIEQIYALINEDMRKVNMLIKERLRSEVALVNELGNYIIAGGGKRLRPILVLLCAYNFGYHGNYHIDLAAVIEFIHTATLLHDDVVDSSELRRGRKTANNLWGNEASVLVGDFLYSRSFQMMVKVGNSRVMEIVANATNIIAEGEVMQLIHCRDPEISESRYFEVIRCKTATLFAAAAELGALLANCDIEIEHAAANYGRYLGNAFQLIDDVLDYSASSIEIGKNIGDDLEEGKPTLPLIYILRNGTASQRAIITDAILNGGRENLDQIIKIIEDSGAISYTVIAAQREAEKALLELKKFPLNNYRNALEGLVEFAVNRKY